MRVWEVFESVDGYVNGKPYVLPHAPGEPAQGLESGFYFWFTEPDESGPEGPFNSARAARKEMARMIDAIPQN